MSNEQEMREAFAAGMRKAAQIVHAKGKNAETVGWLEEAEELLYLGNEILSAIPTDSKAALSTEAQPEVTGAVAVYSGDHDGHYGMIEYLVHQGAPLKVGGKLYTTEAIQEAVNAKSEALKERDRLGYAVVQLVEAVDALLEAGSDEYLHDENGDFTYEEAPSDYWADLRTAADNMVLRAEDFEEKYRALMESPHASVEEPAK